ncbi:MAG: adenosine deaminase family protein [Acidobacteria bacterium]|nr:adenosine deaminase family protein [Acidobacteriota bacterium]
MKLSKQVIRELPKTDLHLHLDGSLRIGTLLELAREKKIELPSDSEAGMLELVFKERYDNLTEYLKGFQYTVAVLQDPESLERVSFELMEDNIREGVRYIEVRFAPHLHIRPGLEFKDVLLAVNRGLQRAVDHYNHSVAAIRDGEEPPFAYGIIVCALRKFEPVYSDYYRQLYEIHQFSTQKEVFQMAAIELARAAVRVRDEFGIPVVGFDLAGDEMGYPAIDFKPAYDFVHRNFMKKTVHAGEAYGPESIFQAITELHADRIGHGNYLFATDMIRSNDILDKQDYVERLSQYIADRRITIEVCLSSNMQTIPTLHRIADHSFGQMIDNRLSCTLCTDNRLVSRTSVSRELELAIKHFPFTVHQLKDMLVYGFKRSFFFGPYTRKRRYVRQNIDYLETVLVRHQIVDDDLPLED